MPISPDFKIGLEEASPKQIKWFVNRLQGVSIPRRGFFQKIGFFQ